MRSFWYIWDWKYKTETQDDTVSLKFINMGKKAVGKEAFFHVTTKLLVKKQPTSCFFLFPFLLQNISVKAFREKQREVMK